MVIISTGLFGCRSVVREMDDYLNAAHEHWGFEGTVLVAYKDHVILKKGYGKANQVMDIANTPQTKFFIGSITKQFTAAAILKLQEKGLLSVTDTISTYLPDFPRDIADRITIHQLLTHTSGLPNYTDSPEILLRRTTAIKADDLYDFIRHQSLEFIPGTQFKYSNSGYILLGEIIRRVSGQSYEAFLHNEILKPAEMHNSGYARREAGLPDRAVGYTTESGGQLVTAPMIHFSVLHTAGALYSTVEDMLKWDVALHSGKILSDSSLAMMFTPYTGFYGYGWYIDELYGHPHVFHTGLLDGFNTIIDRWTDDQLTIIVFSNDDNAPVDKIAHGLARIAFRMPYDFPFKKKPIPYNLAALLGYEGVYQSGSEQYRIVTAFEDELYTYNYGDEHQKLLQQAPDTFFFDFDNTQLIVFRRDRDKLVNGLLYINEGVQVPAGKLNDIQAAGFIIHKEHVELTEDELHRFVGQYQSIGDESGAVQLTLNIEPGTYNSLIAVFDRERVEVYPYSETEFSHQAADFLLTFIVDDFGLVTGCTITLGGRKVLLQKVS
ncbi:MAG: serine hydrolase domain-containing protein [Candidatus Zixiibacteriota bacterium]